MKNQLSILTQALNKANQGGVFNLQESAVVAQALSTVAQYVERNEARDEVGKNIAPCPTPVNPIVNDNTEKVVVKGDA
tara:strand:- start:2648 stop:2881 length:234 start_codon:yes stop_codon:yes gene_type:complete